MKKKFLKWYAILGIVCVLGFSIGFYFDGFIDDEINAKASATSNVTSPSTLDIGVEEIDCSDVFDETLYTSVYNKNDRTIYVSFNNDVATRTTLNAKRYTRDDSKNLTTAMLDKGYEFIMISNDECSCMYEEYKDGHQTGGLATYLFDDNGYVTEATFREGTIYDFDEKEMISEEYAFQLAVKAIKEKYGEDTVVEGRVYDYVIKTYYVPKRDEICYWIDKIIGHVPEYVGTIADPVYFYVTVSPDGSFVEVASSLRY